MTKPTDKDYCIIDTVSNKIRVNDDWDNTYGWHSLYGISCDNFHTIANKCLKFNTIAEADAFIVAFYDALGDEYNTPINLQIMILFRG